ncbi:MAG: carboxypeptidase-like regulatory domain-containing protein, partial [Candidatus Hydrogenedens sp.]|nr:carboxypeptidase-like regulatory domain-containing protein [Candidatus Hydrogenedens sp.]
GVQIGDSIPIIRRCIFRTSDSIDTVSPTSIYIKDNQSSSNPSNSLGDINDPNTGWNTFELESGKAIINERSTPIIADNNDWGTEDTTSLVEGNVKINYALKKGSALVASSLSFVVWNASNKQSVLNATISLSPSVYPPLSQNTNGVYTFSSIPEGTYNVTITAPSFQNHSLTTTVPAGNIKSESVALKPVTTQEGSNDGTHDGSPDGSVDGSNEGAVDGTHDGSNDGTNEGQTNEGEPTKPVKKCGCNQKGNNTSISEIAIISLAISMLGMYRPKKNKRL